MAIYHLPRISATLVCVISIVLLVLLHPAGAAQFDDWIVSETCSRDENKLCHGYYLQPTFPQVDPNTPQPIKINSEEASLVAKGTSVFSGNVKATQGDKIIYADKATVVRNPTTGEVEEIILQGNIQMMEPGLRLDGTNAVAYVGQDRKTIENGVYRIYDRHAHGFADNIEIFADDRMILCNATYTTCAPYSKAWYLKAKKAKFDKISGRGEAWHSFLYMQDFPVFYWPYVNFPIDKRRQTGFLQPEYEGSSNNGATFIAPFYWNMAPNFDTMIRSQYMTKRSWKFDNTFRYLTDMNSGALKFDFLPHDRAYQALRNTQYSNTAFMQATDSATAMRRNDMKPRDFRYRFTATDSTRFNKNWTFLLDYTTASDGNYFYDFTTDQSAQIYALQQAALNFNGWLGIAKLQFMQYQTFHVVNGPSGTEQLAKMPEFAYSSTMFDLPYGFHWATTANYTNFRPKNIADNNNPLSFGQRTHARPGIYYNFVEPGWFIKPRVQLNYLNYSDLTITPANQASGVKQQSSNTFIPMYDVHTGLIFERNWQHNIVQTLEPQLYYLYVPETDQSDLPIFDSSLMTFDYNQVFRDNRYTGLDRVSEANQIGLGLASKFYNDNGDEIAMLGIGQIYYFRNVILQIDKEQDYTYKHWSPFAAIGSIRLAPDYNLLANWVHFRTTSDTASVQLQYHPSKYKVFNIGYELAHNPDPDDLTGQYNGDVHQFNVSTAWQITPPLRVLGRFNYDMRFSRNLNTLAGIEYHTCCTALRLIWSRVWEASTVSLREHKHSFHIQFIFKGFTGVGNAEDSFLISTIPGYIPGPSH